MNEDNCSLHEERKKYVRDQLAKSQARYEELLNSVASNYAFSGAKTTPYALKEESNPQISEEMICTNYIMSCLTTATSANHSYFPFPEKLKTLRHEVIGFLKTKL